MKGGKSASDARADSALQGTWRAVDATVSGSAAPQVNGNRLKFSGDRFQICKDSELRYGGTISSDPAASPPAIEFDQSETDTLAGIWLGIYEVRGDTLTICDNAPDMEKPRPESFGDGATAGYIVVHIRREG